MNDRMKKQAFRSKTVSFSLQESELVSGKIQARSRIGWIDIAKAIGILVVLINHAELQLGAATYLGGMFYMPIFFVLSGYTYKDNRQESVKSFTISKAKRLLIPYMWFQIALLALFTVQLILAKQSLVTAIVPILGAFYSRNVLYANALEVFVTVPTNNIEFFKALNAPLWFLTGLFITLILYKLIMTLAKGNLKREWIYLSISIFIGILLKYFCPILLPWSIDTAFISVGFVHMGKIMRQKNVVLKLYNNPFYVIVIVLVFIAISYINGSVNMSVREFGKSTLLYLVVGGTGSLLLMLISKAIEEHTRITSHLFIIIGRHTIGILAFHLVAFGVIGVLLHILGISGEIIEKVAKIIVSVVILVPTDWFIQRYLPFVYGIKRRI